MKQWTRHTIRKAPETSQCDSFFWVFVFLVLIPEHTGMQPSVNCKQQYNKNEPYLKAFWSILCHLICLHQELNRWSMLDLVHLNTISHVYPHGSQNTLTYLCFNASILTITPTHVFILLFNQSSKPSSLPHLTYLCCLPLKWYYRTLQYTAFGLKYKFKY